MKAKLFLISASLALLASLAFTGCAPIALAPPASAPKHVVLKKDPLSVIWVVSEQRTLDQWFETTKATLDLSYSMRLVAALPAKFLIQMDEAAAARLSELQANGRLEIAAQPIGSLPLNLLKDFKKTLEESWGRTRNQTSSAPRKILKTVEVERLIVLTEELWTKKFPNRELGGLVPGLGVWESGLRPGNFAWVLGASTDASCGRAGEIKPLRLNASALESRANLLRLQGLVVIDEIYNVAPETAENTLKTLARISDGGDASWQMVDLAYWADVPPLALPSPPRPFAANSWAQRNAGDDFWGSVAQKNYWPLIARLRSDILQYQNSGRATITVLDRLWENFFQILSHREISALRETDTQTPGLIAQDKHFLTQVGSMYQQMSPALAKKPTLPDSLWNDLSYTSTGDSTALPLAAGSLHEIRFTDLYDAMSPSQNNIEADLSSLSVQWSDQEFFLTAKLSGAATSIVPFELYIDLNRRPYEGNGKSRDGSLRAAPLDFWEYYLEGGADGSLDIERYSPGGTLVRVARLPNAVAMDGPAIKTRFPRSWIAAKNPRHWGWALCLKKIENSQSDEPPSERRQDCLQNGPVETDELPFVRE